MPRGLLYDLHDMRADAVTTSAFEALEDLDDDLDTSMLASASRHSRLGGSTRSSSQLVGPAAASASTHRSGRSQSSCQHDASREGNSAASGQRGGPPTLSHFEQSILGEPPAALAFVAKLKQKGLFEHNGFTNAMNPVTRVHDPSLRSQYSLLRKPEQQALWRIIPHAGIAKGKGRALAGAATPSHACVPSCAPLAVGRGVGAGGGRRGGGKRSGQGIRGRAEGVDTSWDDVGSPLAVDAEGAAAVDDDGLCVVCMGRHRDALILPCKHTVLCIMCAMQVREFSNECPYCRCRIEDILHVQ
jgi:hypothetical protein